MPDNAARVNAWMASVPAAPPADVIAALERGLNALWRCALTAVAAPTLSAVLTQILRDAAMRFPVMAFASLDGGTGISVDDLRARTQPEHAQQLREGTRYVLLRFIEVVGQMTGGALTPALRAALDTTL